MAQKDGRSVHLNWTTNTEFKNEQFEVERSSDSVNFETILTKESFGSNSEALAAVYYKDTDLEPLIGVNYYRLKQVYLDGSHRYSTIQEVVFDVNVFEFTTFPNPTKGEIFVNLKELSGRKATILVYDILGQPIKQLFIEEVPEQPIRLDLSNYASGIYSIRVNIDGIRSKTNLINLTKF